MAKSTTPKVRKNRQAKRETLAGYLFLLPNFIGFFVFTAVPIVAGLVLSFTDFNGFKASFLIFLSPLSLTKLTLVKLDVVPIL